MKKKYIKPEFIPIELQIEAPLASSSGYDEIEFGGTTPDFYSLDDEPSGINWSDIENKYQK